MKLSRFRFAAVVALMLPMAANADLVIADFESGQPSDFFSYTGPDSGLGFAFVTIGESSSVARPGQVGNNGALLVDFDTTPDFGGVGQDYAPAPQDWTSFVGVSFWLFGQGTGDNYQFEIFDNRSDPATDTAERFDSVFVDDTAGWSQITLLFSDFTRAVDFQPGGAPDDGLTLTDVWGYAFVLDGADSRLFFDDVTLITSVSEPSTLGLLGLGLLGLAVRRRRRD